MKRVHLLALMNTVGFILTIVLNGLAVYLPINGNDTGKLSDLYPNLFVPAGQTFSIWGIIFLLLLLMIIYQWVVALGSSRDDSFIYKIGPWFFISSLANCSWILAWHYLMPGLSFFIMIILLISLIKIYLSLGIGKTNVPIIENYIVHACFSIYLGWITVAVIANATAVLVGMGWKGGGIDPAVWTILMIAIAVAIGIYFSWAKADYFYTVVIVWALYGIYLKRSSVIPVEGGIVLASQIGMLLIGILMLFLVVKRRLIRTN